MQTQNVNVAITVTGRHVEITEPMRDYAHKKVEGLHLDYPKIIEAKVILDVQAHHSRHLAEIILFCANHITIEAHSETHDMYASIDETIGKIARRMRKHKTRLLRKHRPRKSEKIQHLAEAVFSTDVLAAMEGESESGNDAEAEAETDLEPVIVHKENYRIRPLYQDEAMIDMELSEKPFVVFRNAKNDKLSILFRRKDGDYGVIEPEV